MSFQSENDFAQRISFGTAIAGNLSEIPAVNVNEGMEDSDSATEKVAPRRLRQYVREHKYRQL